MTVKDAGKFSNEPTERANESKGDDRGGNQGLCDMYESWS